MAWRFHRAHFMTQRKGQFVIVEGIEHSPYWTENDTADRFKGVQIRRGIGIDIVIAFDHPRPDEVVGNPVQPLLIFIIICHTGLGLGLGQHLRLHLRVHLDELLLDEGRCGSAIEYRFHGRRSCRHPNGQRHQ